MIPIYWIRVSIFALAIISIIIGMIIWIIKEERKNDNTK